MRLAILAALALVCAASSADARPRHRQPALCVETGDVLHPVCGADIVSSAPVRAVQSAVRSGGTIIGGRPRGCPRAFCGCGASLRIFGKIIPLLNLARNWLAFPRAAPAAGMVAVRRHHVFVLERHIAGTTWLAHDSNSGGGKTRLHARSIVGFAIVDPHGGRYAQAR